MFCVQIVYFIKSLVVSSSQDTTEFFVEYRAVPLSLCCLNVYLQLLIVLVNKSSVSGIRPRHIGLGIIKVNSFDSALNISSLAVTIAKDSNRHYM
jgi:hypothetical protein